MPRNILIVYGSTQGQTRKVAHALAEELAFAGATADVIDARERRPTRDPGDYDGIIVAASVHAGGYQRGVRRWVKAHAGAIACQPNAFVSVCLGVLEHKPETDRELERIMARFFALTGWTPSMRKIVAGALPYSKYNWLMRRMIRRIVAKAGGDVDTSRDYEYTDWADVRAFARTFLAAIPVWSPAPSLIAV